MSVHAHRVNKLEYKEGTSFNLWENEDLVTFLLEENSTTAQRLNAGTGMVDIAAETIEKALEEIKNLEPCIKEALAEDLAWAKKNDKEYILYDCF